MADRDQKVAAPRAQQDSQTSTSLKTAALPQRGELLPEMQRDIIREGRKEPPTIAQTVLRYRIEAAMAKAKAGDPEPLKQLTDTLHSPALTEYDYINQEMIRDKINRSPFQDLKGSSTTIIILESPSIHGVIVGLTANEIAPQSKLVPQIPPFSKKISGLPDDPKALGRYVWSSNALVLDSIASSLREITKMQQAHPVGQRIIVNMSLGVDVTTHIVKLAEALSEGKFPTIAKALFHTDKVKFILPKFFYDTLITYTRNSLAADPEGKRMFEKSVEAYKAATLAASNAQIPIVVAAGNERMKLGEDYRNDRDLQSNALHTPNTIVVGSSRNNLLPGSSPDHSLSSFSSLPNNKNHITVLAPGDRVITSYVNTPLIGTSISSPKVAAVVALMLEYNPRLTPKEIAEILEKTATPLVSREDDKDAVGGGALSVFHVLQEVEGRMNLPKIQDPIPIRYRS